MLIRQFIHCFWELIVTSGEGRPELLFVLCDFLFRVYFTTFYVHSSPSVSLSCFVISVSIRKCWGNTRARFLHFLLPH